MTAMSHIDRNSSSVLRIREMNSPVGPLVLASTDNVLCGIFFGSYTSVASNLRAWAKRWFGADSLTMQDSGEDEAVRQLQQYFAGERTQFTLKLDMRGTPFQLKVWNALTSIPYGESRSYGDIARGIGSAKAVRAVGGANKRNPLPIVIPCHRVIGSTGQLVGYGGGLPAKRYLLELETMGEKL